MLGTRLAALILAALSTTALLAQDKTATVNQPSTGHFLTVGQRPPLGEAQIYDPPAVMHLCIAHCFPIKWENGHYINHGPSNTSIYTVEKFDGKSLVLHRKDTGSFPLTAVLTGQIAKNGSHIVSGKIVWTSGNTGEGTFRAAWGPDLSMVPASDPPPPPGSTNSVQGLVNFLALFAGPNLGDTGDSGGGGGLTERISDLRSRLSNARSYCHSHTVNGRYDCPAEDSLEDKLIDANAALQQEMRQLQEAQKSLGAKCKANDKQSCATLQKVNAQLEKDRNFQALSVITDF